MRLLRVRITVVASLDLGTRVCRDPKDDHILGTAIQGDCRCIIIGDKDLLTVKKHRDIKIIIPRNFWEYESRALGKHVKS